MSRKNTPEHFWSRVAVKGEDECWEWLGSKTNSRYGSLHWNDKTVQAHRVAAYLNGLITAPHTGRRRTDPVSKFSVLHKCDNRLCCNPTHLEVGDYTKNQCDAYARARREQPKGMHHTNAKLTNEQAQEIREIYGLGNIRQIDIAKKYGTSQYSISLIIRQKTYKD